MYKKSYAALLALVLVCVCTVMLGAISPAANVTASAAGTYAKALRDYLSEESAAWTLVSGIDQLAEKPMTFDDAARTTLATRWLTGESAVKRLAKYGLSEQSGLPYAESLTKLRVVESMLYGKHQFPLPKASGYMYENSWGAPRTFGGARSHQGIDLIAAKGTPVSAISAGVVTKKGWDEKGGWRIGVTDANGIYYYYAHFSQYQAGVEIGTYVQPGDIIGYVGSTGYGPEGTDDVMIPHLHVGLYDYTDQPFNPYPFLLYWENPV